MTNTTDDYQLADNISFSQIDNEMVLLNLNSGNYFGLNAVGVEIINHLIEGKGIPDIVKILTDKYGVETSIINADVNDLLQQLLDNELILVK